MGLFGNLKKILFEDDDEEEVSEMPTYTKEDIVDSSKNSDNGVVVEPVVEEPIKTSDRSHFTNVKRDIDLNFDETDVLGEIPGAKDVMNEKKEEDHSVSISKMEEKKSVFPSFDEEEFERLNSRITKNENRVRKEIQQAHSPHNISSVNEARRANNNFSATSTNRELRVDNNDRYKINNDSIKKTFTPSPIISPVYGILDKNYTKDDIVDKKGGMKREKVIKPVVKAVEKNEDSLLTEKTKETVVEVDIDSVRKKAYGTLSEIEKNLTKENSNRVKKEVELEVPELKKDVKVALEEPIVEEVSPVVVSDNVERVVPSIEEQLENESFEVEDISVEEENASLDKVVEDVIEKKDDLTKESSVKSNPKILDDLEKTSTLQILDDIEKELNSIKPINKDISVDTDDEELTTNNTDTLEKDLFNLIDSMYVEGEEEDDD